MIDNNGIPNYMLIDNDLVSWDYFIRIENMDGLVEIGPYPDRASADIVSDCIRNNTPACICPDVDVFMEVSVS